MLQKTRKVPKKGAERANQNLEWEMALASVPQSPGYTDSNNHFLQNSFFLYLLSLSILSPVLEVQFD